MVNWTLVFTKQAQKDATIEKLNSVEGIADVIDKIQNEDTQRFLQAIGGKTGSTAAKTTPPANPPTAA